ATSFPYTTLFRSDPTVDGHGVVLDPPGQRERVRQRRAGLVRGGGVVDDDLVGTVVADGHRRGRRPGAPGRAAVDGQRRLRQRRGGGERGYAHRDGAQTQQHRTPQQGTAGDLGAGAVVTGGGGVHRPALLSGGRKPCRAGTRIRAPLGSKVITVTVGNRELTA